MVQLTEQKQMQSAGISKSRFWPSGKPKKQVEIRVVAGEGHELEVSFHCMSFSCASLAIGEHCALKSPEHIVEDRGDCLREHIRLRREGREHIVEVVGGTLLPHARTFDYRYLLLLRTRSYDR